MIFGGKKWRDTVEILSRRLSWTKRQALASLKPRAIRDYMIICAVFYAVTSPLLSKSITNDRSSVEMILDDTSCYQGLHPHLHNILLIFYLLAYEWSKLYRNSLEPSLVGHICAVFFIHLPISCYNPGRLRVIETMLERSCTKPRATRNYICAVFYTFTCCHNRLRAMEFLSRWS